MAGDQRLSACMANPAIQVSLRGWITSNHKAISCKRRETSHSACAAHSIALRLATVAWLAFLGRKPSCATYHNANSDFPHPCGPATHCYDDSVNREARAVPNACPNGSAWSPGTRAGVAQWQRQPRHAKALALDSAFAAGLQIDCGQASLSRCWFNSSPPRHHASVA